MSERAQNGWSATVSIMRGREETILHVLSECRELANVSSSRSTISISSGGRTGLPSYEHGSKHVAGVHPVSHEVNGKPGSGSNKGRHPPAQKVEQKSDDNGNEGGDDDNDEGSDDADRGENGNDNNGGGDYAKGGKNEMKMTTMVEVVVMVMPMMVMGL
ncbi:hypothetical protein PoB_005076900 [Plakobranchus ocellatus]|uniref:Uncharacterized protein n=1 Tax=Plakobranchus ocellatus TaxID=259542 RepID=A0AAV4BZG8_9GAST|nr:hypothetical protein PoB_005076900 [Plakobranchus ocellatus]